MQEPKRQEFENASKAIEAASFAPWLFWSGVQARRLDPNPPDSIVDTLSKVAAEIEQWMLAFHREVEIIKRYEAEIAACRETIEPVRAGSFFGASAHAVAIKILAPFDCFYTMLTKDNGRYSNLRIDWWFKTIGPDRDAIRLASCIELERIAFVAKNCGDKFNPSNKRVIVDFDPLSPAIVVGDTRHSLNGDLELSAWLAAIVEKDGEPVSLNDARKHPIFGKYIVGKSVRPDRLHQRLLDEVKPFFVRVGKSGYCLKQP